MLEDDDREQLYRDYTATMQRHLVTMLYKHLYTGDWEPPSYLDAAHPSAAAQPATETPEDTKAHVYKIFGITE